MTARAALTVAMLAVILTMSLLPGLCTLLHRSGLDGRLRPPLQVHAAEPCPLHGGYGVAHHLDLPRQVPVKRGAARDDSAHGQLAGSSHCIFEGILSRSDSWSDKDFIFYIRTSIWKTAYVEKQWSRVVCADVSTDPLIDLPTRACNGVQLLAGGRPGRAAGEGPGAGRLHAVAAVGLDLLPHLVDHPGLTA
jgi:hypothetical protein